MGARITDVLNEKDHRLYDITWKVYIVNGENPDDPHGARFLRNTFQEPVSLRAIKIALRLRGRYPAVIAFSGFLPLNLSCGSYEDSVNISRSQRCPHPERRVIEILPCNSDMAGILYSKPFIHLQTVESILPFLIYLQILPGK
jgi:hypothetical protein